MMLTAVSPTTLVTVHRASDALSSSESQAAVSQTSSLIDNERHLIVAAEVFQHVSQVQPFLVICAFIPLLARPSFSAASTRVSMLLSSGFNAVHTCESLEGGYGKSRVMNQCHLDISINHGLKGGILLGIQLMPAVVV